ncbi:MAG: TIM barrel protein [Rhodobacteraceae bacterium]|nr:TIM barrel protein [Paracoccaceae bacterium]
MMKFAANLDFLFAELPFAERFAAAAEAGFAGVEVNDPYHLSAQDLRHHLVRTGHKMVVMDAPPPNYTGGMPGFAALPEGRARFQSDVRRVLRYASILKPAHIHLTCGAASGDAAHDALVDNLKWAADFAPNQSFVIAPKAPAEVPGYFLTDFPLADRVLAAVDRANVGLQYDSAHARQTGGDAVAVWAEHASRVAHVRVAQSPDRSEPADGGDIDFAALRTAFHDSGYDGWIAAAYVPRTTTKAGLEWLSRWAAAG